MEYTLFCCNHEQPCKVYNMPTNKAWKRLYFLDACGFCGATVAAIWECSMDGTLKLVVRKTGKKAMRMRDNILNKKLKDFPLAIGSWNNERIFYNNKGVIFNFNNRRIGSQKKFLSYTHS